MQQHAALVNEFLVTIIKPDIGPIRALVYQMNMAVLQFQSGMFPGHRPLEHLDVAEMGTAEADCGFCGAKGLSVAVEAKLHFVQVTGFFELFLREFCQTTVNQAASIGLDQIAVTINKREGWS